MSQTNADPHANLTVHVRGDSDTNLEALFNVLNNVDPSKLQNSFKNRNLPPSFFKPPEPRHSREGSEDSTSSFDVSRVGPHPSMQLSSNHGRSHSSPAQLPRTLIAVPPPPIHIKQTSLAGEFSDELGPLPPGWDGNKGSNGQRYFLSPTAEGAVGSWPDPRKSMSTSALHSQSSHQALPALPPGWEQAVTNEGEIYYINHLDKTTSWYDPRIPKHLQRPGPVKVGQALMSPPQLDPSAAPQPAGPVGAGAGAAAAAAAPPRQPLPQQQQQQQPAGRSQQAIRGELQRLQQEIQRLQRQHEEVARQGQGQGQGQGQVRAGATYSPATLRPFSQNLSAHTNSPSVFESASPSRPYPAADITPNMQSAMQSVAASGVDPFLGQASNTLEPHVRQSSGDSGLGGMGNSYSLPRTPEDLLSNVDEMDIHDGAGKLVKPAGVDFGMGEIASAMTMDVGSVSESGDQAGGMDTDDLVPTLQEDISNDLLNDMDVQKMDSLLTWL